MFATPTALSRTALGACLLAGVAAAQGGLSSTTSNVVVPQRGTLLVQENHQRLAISAIEARVRISQQVAVVTIDTSLKNNGSRVEEAELFLPVPRDAVVRGLDFEGGAAEPTAELLESTRAHSIYNQIVGRSRDPALLEFAGHSAIHTSVFPVPAYGTQTVRVIYEHVLEADGDRVDFVLPRSEDLIMGLLPWTIEVELAIASPISTVYSPTHAIEQTRISRGEIHVLADRQACREPGPFRLSYLLEGNGVNASLYPFPDERVGGGFFLLLAGLPVELDPEARRAVLREVILVLDTSGSMAGDKFEQARAAALQILQGLRAEDAFNVIDFDNDVATLFPAPRCLDDGTRAAAVGYLERLEPGGGTALDAALGECLRQKGLEGYLSQVLFLTDGLPTVGPKSELAIRERAERDNHSERRIFTLGVGYDVNVPLLDRLADVSRGTSSYVHPEEDVEIAVSELFSRLGGPVLASPELRVLDDAGDLAPHLVADVLPARLPDVYEGDQVTLLGQYRGREPLTFELSGDYLGVPRSFRFRFAVDRPSVSNDFVPRLWASRRIAQLIDEIRYQGANPGLASAGSGSAHAATRELTDEILRLSSSYGVLTEYTAFLAKEGTNLADRETAVARLESNLLQRAQQVRSGRGAVNQSVNSRRLANLRRQNAANEFLDADLKLRRIQHVRQIGELTFYRRSKMWIDGRLLRTRANLVMPPEELIAFGSFAHRELVGELIERDLQGVFSLRGTVYLELDGKPVRIPHPQPLKPAEAAQPGPQQAQGATPTPAQESAP